VIAVIAAVGWGLVIVLAVWFRLALAARAVLVARACHELRGPLCAIGLGVELVTRTGRLPALRVRALELELGRARQALDDLVLAGGVRARAHPARVAPREVGLGALVSESVEAWRDAANGRPMRVELPVGREVFVAGDRVRLAQALGNLLANAVEHGGGSVLVRLRVGEQLARIEVADGGRGLPAPLPRLTAPGGRWRQLPWPLRVRERGHGLGIAAAVARAHAGRLISAPSDTGARLVLELPLARPGSVRRAAG
jgi:signal transduction histidine kinase